MAKAKKGKLTIEDALVPVEEQLYEIPKNWQWAKIGALVELHRGVSYKKTDAHDIKKDGDCLILRGGNIGEGYIDTEADNVFVSRDLVNESQLVCKDDIVIVGSTGSVKVIGRAGISDQDYSDVAFGAFLMLVRPKKEITSKYVDYYFQGNEYRNRIRTLANGVNINNIKAEYILDAPIPLPPLAEQKRIVEQIENLFAKLYEAKEKAQIVVDSFEIRRASVLHDAFTGKLSVKWRNEKNREISSREVFLGDITDIKSSKRVYKEDYVDSGVPFFRSTEVVELYDYGTTTPNMFITREKYEEIKKEKGVPRQGNLLVTSVGTIGKTWIVDDREFYYKDGNLTEVEQCDELDMRFLQYFIMSEEFNNQVIDTVSGSAYNALTIVKFKKIKIMLPEIDEQQFIVGTLEKVLSKEAQAKEAAEQVIEQIDLMKKSILAKAFRGELGTNIVDEESSIELLKKIIDVKG